MAMNCISRRDLTFEVSGGLQAVRLTDGLGANGGTRLRECADPAECSATANDARPCKVATAQMCEPPSLGADRREDGQHARTSEPKPWRWARKPPKADGLQDCAFAAACA